jgi:MFS family permease
VLLVTFVVIETRTSHPLLPMRVILDRNRGGAFLSALLIGVGLFGVFLFLTFYLQVTLGYSALMTGVAFLPFTFGIIGGAGVSAALQTRFGPRVLMFSGMLLAAIGMVLLTRIGVDTGFWSHVFPGELVMSFGLGRTVGPLSNTALVGVADHDAGVASALINTTQQIGGSLGTALLNTIFTSAVAGYITSHQAALTSKSQLPALTAVATVHSYTVAFWVSAGLIGLAAVMALVLVRASRDEVASTDGVAVAV